MEAATLAAAAAEAEAVAIIGAEASLTPGVSAPVGGRIGTQMESIG